MVLQLLQKMIIIIMLTSVTVISAQTVEWMIRFPIFWSGHTAQQMGTMLVPSICFIYLLSLLMKYNTIKKIQLLSLSRTLAEESTFQFGLIRNGIFISTWQNTNFLFISKTIHTLPYSHLYTHSGISEHAVRVWFCLNNSSLV